MARHLSEFVDILEPRRNEFSNFMWASREVNLLLPNRQIKPVAPDSHKVNVFNSPRIQLLIERVNL